MRLPGPPGPSSSGFGHPGRPEKDERGAPQSGARRDRTGVVLSSAERRPAG